MHPQTPFYVYAPNPVTFNYAMPPKVARCVRPRSRIERMKRHAMRELGSRDVMVVACEDMATGAAHPAIKSWAEAWREFHPGWAYVERTEDYPTARTVTFRMVAR